MELDEKRDDRDYLYGRLLALADNFESGVLYQRNISRPTNAVKLMSNFVAKPFSTWGNLWKQIDPYMKSSDPKLLGRAKAFQNHIDDVMHLFKDGEYEHGGSLSPLFLLGYSHQRRAIKQQKTATAASTTDND